LRLNSPAHLLASIVCLSIVVLAGCLAVRAQTDNTPFPQATELQQGSPLTNQEFVRLLYQLPAHPEGRDALVDEIRKRGIGFQLTSGLRSLAATKSGNDSTLLHTLDEAERRRLNPTVAARPSIAEANELLERARKATLGATEKMPDYLVKQQITRARAFGGTNNWQVYDRLTIAVSYRQSVGEQYKLLSINGMPPGEEEREGSSYGDKLGGTTSSGEYVSMLAQLFAPETRAEFQAVDTDTIRGHRTVVYEYSVKKEFSRQTLKFQESLTSPSVQTIVGYRGRVWIERETYRVLRLESISTEIPSDFPITAAQSLIDYDVVTINEQEHLLPSRAVIELADHVGLQREQTRNDILFRGYRKFGAEVKIVDIDEKDFPPDKPEENEPSKPETKPQPPKKPNE
jgi:hypothetical protein